MCSEFGCAGKEAVIAEVCFLKLRIISEMLALNPQTGSWLSQDFLVALKIPGSELVFELFLPPKSKGGSESFPFPSSKASALGRVTEASSVLLLIPSLKPRPGLGRGL